MSYLTTSGTGVNLSGTISTGSSIWVDPNYNPYNIGGVTTKTYVDNTIYDYTGEGIEIKIEDDESLSSSLSVCYKEIKDGLLVFNVFMDHVKKEPNPIEDVMRMIRKKVKFDFTLNRNGYILDVKGVEFVRIKNLIETSANQYIEVEFRYENMDYNNTLKSELDKRAEKLELLKDKINDK